MVSTLTELARSSSPTALCLEGHQEQRVTYLLWPTPGPPLMLPAAETWSRSPSSHLHHIVGTHRSEKSSKPTARCSSPGISRRTHRSTFQSTGAISAGRVPPSGWPCWTSSCKSCCWRTLPGHGSHCATRPRCCPSAAQPCPRTPPFESMQPV